MSCAESAREKVLLMAEELSKEAKRIGILRSLDATETSRWLEEISSALMEACGPGSDGD